MNLKSSHDPSVAILAAVHGAVVELTGCTPASIAPSSDLVADLGLDSFMIVEFLGCLERALGVKVPSGYEGRLARAKTVGALVEELERAFQTSPE